MRNPGKKTAYLEESASKMATDDKNIFKGKAGSRREFLVEFAGLAAGTAALGTTLKAAPINEIVLVRNGRSSYSIVLSPGASLSEQRGARELQHFLQEMSGAELPIISRATKSGGNSIFVGQGAALDALKPGIPYEKLGPEGFAIKTIGANLVISGGRQRGTMYGVYTFLEKLGCRWFAEDASRIPHRTTITVAALDETQRPAFEYREPFAGEAFGKDWGARNKVNGGAGTKLDASTGGSIKYFPFVHSFYRMIPPKKYFAEHPEYFSLIDGRRTHQDAQLCLTNAELVRVATEVVIGWIKDHPDVQIFSVSQNDCNGWCECANCQKVVKEEGAISGVLLRFVNAIAENIATRYPDKLIDTLAYQMSETPPRHVRPGPNVRVRLCPIGNCQAHPFEICPWSLPFMQNLRGWSTMTNHLYIWHYTTNFASFLLPFPDFDEIAVDTGMYRRHGVVGIFFEDDGRGGAQGSVLRSYLMARLLWNPATNVQQDIKEFHETYYGRAAQPLLDYHNFLQRKVRFAPDGEGQHITIGRSPRFSATDFRHMRGLFRRAEELAANEPTLHRVKKARLSLDYAELLASKRFAVSRGNYAPVDLPGIKKRYHHLLAEVKRFGNIALHEAGTTAGYEQLFATYMKAYPATQIENDLLLAQVVPGLNGRIVGLIEKSSGRNVLRSAVPEEVFDPFEIWKPDFGGIGVFVYEDYFAPDPTGVDWNVEARSVERRACRLKGETASGLHLEHALELASTGASLRSHTHVVNHGALPVTFTLTSRLQPNPVNRNAPLEFDINFRARNGKRVAFHYSSLAERFQGYARYEGSELPDGEWRLKHSLLGLDFITRFDPAQVDRCTALWSAIGQNWTKMGVWSKKRTVAPGESMELDVSYHIQAGSPMANL